MRFFNPALLLAFPMVTLPGAAQTQDSRGQSFHVVVAPAESLHVTVDGVGDPVVLIPGLVGSSFGYRLLRAELTRAGFSAVVIEPLGLGDSPRPERANYSLTSQADRVGAVMARLNLEDAIVVAHAVGASIALRLSYRHPGRVRAILSLDGGAADRAATPGLRRAIRFIPLVKLFGGVKLVRRKLRDQLIDGSGDTTWVTDQIIDGYTAGHARDLDGTLKAYLRMGEARESESLATNLGRILIPVRLLIGEDVHPGVIGPEEVELLRATLPNFETAMVPGAGHFLHEEQPGFVLDNVVRLYHLTTAAGTTR
jgi:pimeloyl-ACP methyl ester carboxylesterase